MSVVFLGLALIAVFWGIVSAIVMASFLAKRGHKINILFFRLLILKYIHQYSEITTKETGRPGVWFYVYVISMNLALVFAIVGVALK